MEPGAFLPDLILLFGLLVGFATGLLAAGGGMIAVPLLVWGVGLTAHQAVFLSLITVGVVSLVGALASLRRREVAISTALLFGGGGALAAPLGVRLGHLMPETVLLVLLALLIGVAGVKMWRRAASEECDAPVRRPRQVSSSALIVGGLGVGLLIGIFGIGGGFIMVPAFVLLGGLAMRPALGTALLASAVICAAGVGAQIVAGNDLPVRDSVTFLLGGLPGLVFGRRLGRRVSAEALQKLFAGVLLTVAVLMTVRLAWERLGG